MAEAILLFTMVGLAWKTHNKNVREKYYFMGRDDGYNDHKNNKINKKTFYTTKRQESYNMGYQSGWDLTS
jgi:hypothetical protein